MAAAKLDKFIQAGGNENPWVAVATRREYAMTVRGRVNPASSNFRSKRSTARGLTATGHVKTYQSSCSDVA